MNFVFKLLFSVLMCTVLFPASAFCYVGPGAGLTAIGSFLALCAAVIVGVVGFLWFPIKRILKKKKKHLDEQ